VPAIEEAAESGVDSWQRSPPDAIHAIDREMTRVAYQVIASTILPSDQEAVTAAIERGVAAFNRGLPCVSCVGSNFSDLPQRKKRQLLG
jgi:hypothetical protein